MNFQSEVDRLAGRHYLCPMTFRDRLLDSDYLYCGEPFCDGDHISSSETCQEPWDDEPEGCECGPDDVCGYCYQHAPQPYPRMTGAV